jgi:hypothetical protein
VSRVRQLVRNAADREQVEHSEDVQRRQTITYEHALFNVMNTRDGRVVLTQWLLKMGVGLGQKAVDNGITARELGDELAEDLKLASQDAYFAMEKESRRIIHEEKDG